MTSLFQRFKLNGLLRLSTTRSYATDPVSTFKRGKSAADRALKHFDDLYKSVYGNMWPEIREALLLEQNKHVAVVNNFSDTERIQRELEALGAINFKAIYNSYKESTNQIYQNSKKKRNKANVAKSTDSSLENMGAESEVQSDYHLRPNSFNFQREEDQMPTMEKPLQPTEMRSIEPELNVVEKECSRVVTPVDGYALLSEFMPATTIKGMNDWVLESENYNRYKEASEFKVQVKKDPVLLFPEHLQVYTFEESNDTRFPSPKIGSTGVLDYYLFDGGSILPVLALDLQPGDAVLDMCGAPGGKALTILQTLCPRLMVINDNTESRTARIRKVLDQFLADMGQWEDRLIVTSTDARYIEDKDMYNKILVDVPCTTDRHNLHTTENNIFKPSRIKERLQLPELQAQILTNALKLVQVGGVVVYSTCTLSPIQNDGVVQLSLKKIWEQTTSVMVIKDMTRALQPLKCLYKFADSKLKHGHIVVPTLQNNWGPMYICKIQRIR